MAVRRCLRWWTPLVAAVLAVCASGVTPTPVRAQAPDPFVAGFTASMFSGLNVNDARAALALWANEIASTRGLHISVTVEAFDKPEDVRAAIDAHRLQLLLLSLRQFHELGRPAFGRVWLGGRRGAFRDEYLLVTRRGAAASLAALKGRTLHVVDGVTDDMSRAWLEHELAAASLPPIALHFGAVVHLPKAARAVLPVYFGQADACLVTKAAFETLVELNPQVGRTLSALATSPPLVSGVVLVDRRYTETRPALLEALLGLGASPRGQQVLSLFGVDAMTPARPEDLAPSLQLLSAAARRRP